jgi:hypothetical protein
LEPERLVEPELGVEAADSVRGKACSSEKQAEGVSREYAEQVKIEC